LTIPPVPARENWTSPLDSDAAMPIAFVTFAASRLSSRAVPMAAPNGPVVPGAWKFVSL
jgi:hypothetical protein